MNVWNWRPGTMSRPFAETIPAVTVPTCPNGLPIASTQSPTSMPSELPSFAEGTARSKLILMTARSAKEAVEEVVHPPAPATVVLVIGILSAPPPPTRILDGRFRIDVDHARPQLFGDL